VRLRRTTMPLSSFAVLPLVALGLLALAPTSPPHAPVQLTVAVAVGVLAGTVLFTALARKAPVLRRCSPVAVGAGLSVAAAGAGEEAIWRGFVLARIAPSVGIVAAVLLAAGGFAATHFPALRRRGVAVHLGTGTVFGAVFAATGSLAACAVAHASYNMLALLSREPRAVVASSVASSAASRRTPAARLEHVVKRYGHVSALDGFSLTVAEAEIVALLGPNGAGKTTAVNLLLGLRRADSGLVELFGRDPRAWRARFDIGTTPQEMSFPPTLRVREIVEFARAHYPNARATADLLAQFGLEEVAVRQAGGISGGQRRRLALALAFAGSPRLAVLDEPTTGLDVEARRAVWAVLAEHARDGGAVLLTTHNLDEAEALADRIVVVSHGAVVAAGTPADLMASSDRNLEEAYLRLTGAAT
jgi:ABC-type multidrug transport system ATPase subunit/membrane protease YdiL (CAAX protease family)